jgi:intracellular septation protein
VSPKHRGWVRAAVDFGGPLAFLVAMLATRDPLKATGALIAGSLAGLALGLAVERRIAPMPLIAAAAAILFGGLTLAFQDERFIKIKPTVVNLGFMAFLLGGLVLKKHPLKALLGAALKMPDPAWTTLSLRYAIFFLATALLNEAVWRTQDTLVWAWFRFPGLMLLTIAFTATQFRFLMRNAQTDEPADPQTR